MAVSDLPLILSLGGNLVLGGLGFFGQWQQNMTARHAIDSEGERAREARDEDHFRHRQAVYHDYLNVVRALGPHMARSKTTQTELLAWRNAYEERLNAVVLFGTDAVRAAAEDYHELVARVGVDDDGHELPNHAAIAAHYWSLQSGLSRRFQAVLTAMRDDISPASGRLPRGAESEARS
jgi:hypothetical protein